MATAAYHSETPAIGADYQKKVVARWQLPGHPAFAVSQPTQVAYQAFAPASQAYGAFKPTERVYAAFAEPISPAKTAVAQR